jgi:hypothetical protein
VSITDALGRSLSGRTDWVAKESLNDIGVLLLITVTNSMPCGEGKGNIRNLPDIWANSTNILIFSHLIHQQCL